MTIENLPHSRVNLIDGNLQPSETNENPIYLVLGTASRGRSEQLYTPARLSDAAVEFGQSDGTLTRGMYEAVGGGALNMRLYRIGATSAKLENVGTGITIETVSKDAGAGDAYKIFWDDAAGRLKVWRTSDDLLVYDNNPAYPSAAIDEQEVSVSGTASGSPGDIGTLAVPLTLVQSNGVSGASYTAGTDGITLSRMELFEALHVAYDLLENEEFDVVVPMDTYLDDTNIEDMTTAEVSAVNTSAPWASSSVYPTRGTFYDVLGKVFAQKYLGEWYFWWDMDRDGIAEIWPTVGSATATTDADGNTLELADFHEANFGYQLANFCYTQTRDNQACVGAINMLPPNSWSLKDVANWIGKQPVSSADSEGNDVITTNGTGLLGNKWMFGRKAVAGTGLPGHSIGNVDGLLEGGFIATDTGWPDGTQQSDENDHLIDIGRYLSVVAAQVILSNATSANPYVTGASAVYMGFDTTLPPNSATTNKIQPGVRLPNYRISNSSLDALAGGGYVLLRRRPKGIVVADAPAATRSDSDYKRRMTMKIVVATVDAVRAATEPYLGEGIGGNELAAMETAIDAVLSKLQKPGSGYLIRYEFALTQTPTQRVQGQAFVELKLVPKSELRVITVSVALSAQ